MVKDCTDIGKNVLDGHGGRQVGAWGGKALLIKRGTVKAARTGTTERDHKRYKLSKTTTRGNV